MGLWQGQFHSFDINSDAATIGAHRLNLSLEAPAQIQFSADSLLTHDLCLKGDPERLCVSAERAASSAWDASFKATSLPLHVLTAGLSQDINYEGTLDLDGKAAGEKDQRNTGEFHAQLRDALLRQSLANGREERMALGTGRVDAVVTQDTFNAKVSLDALESGNIKGELSGQRLARNGRDTRSRVHSLRPLTRWACWISSSSVSIAPAAGSARTLMLPERWVNPRSRDSCSCAMRR